MPMWDVQEHRVFLGSSLRLRRDLELRSAAGPWTLRSRTAAAELSGTEFRCSGMMDCAALQRCSEQRCSTALNAVAVCCIVLLRRCRSSSTPKRPCSGEEDEMKDVFVFCEKNLTKKRLMLNLNVKGMFKNKKKQPKLCFVQSPMRQLCCSMDF
jgi:hypothetical protein